MNENYIKFDFRMGTVLLIFSFFQAGKDLVRVPQPHEWSPPTLMTPQLCTYFGRAQKLQAQFS